MTDVRALRAPQVMNQAVAAGYWSADLFIALVRNTGAKLTAARLVKAANQGMTYSVPGVIGPTAFPKAHDIPTPCGSLVRSDGTAFAVRAPFACGKVVSVTR